MINRFILAGAAGLALATTGPAAAQDRFNGVEITTERLSGDEAGDTGVAVLFGAGGNIGVSYGPDGTILIDDQFAPLTSKIQAAVAALGAEPVAYLINTHWHGDHTGGNENFGEAGAFIMAHEHVRERLSGTQKSGRGNDPAAPAAALPVLTWHHGVTLHLNGDDVRVLHMRHGHTDGDSVVYWTGANILHMGDLFFNGGTLPLIDIDSGGNARGLLAAVEKALRMTDDATQIIPGHGPMATRADLVAYRDLLADVIGKVDTARKAGKSLAEIQAMKPAAPYDVNPDAFIKGDAFVEAIYRSLTMPAHADGDH